MFETTKEITNYCIILTPEGKQAMIREIPSIDKYSVFEQHTVPYGSTPESIKKMCKKIENNMEELLEIGIKVKFDVLIDSEIKDIEKIVYNNLALAEIVNIRRKEI